MLFTNTREKKGVKNKKPATPIPTDPTEAGASIQLITSASLPGAWTVVEWQNAHGDWYEVEGWRGHLDEGVANMKTWWVYPENFGETPFRWVIYDEEGGNVTAISDEFTLPTRRREVIKVEVELP